MSLAGLAQVPYGPEGLQRDRRRPIDEAGFEGLEGGGVEDGREVAPGWPGVGARPRLGAAITECEVSLHQQLGSGLGSNRQTARRALEWPGLEARTQPEPGRDEQIRTRPERPACSMRCVAIAGLGGRFLQFRQPHGRILTERRTGGTWTKCPRSARKTTGDDRSVQPRRVQALACMAACPIASRPLMTAATLEPWHSRPRQPARGCGKHTGSPVAPG
jgi:hypothetical protein